MNNIKILGAGLMCIDIIHNNNCIKIMNGGSCANVISVLAQIGFDCSIIRERYSDSFETTLSKTLSLLGVKEIVYRNSSAKTPRIIEMLANSDHKFLTHCPICGENLLKLVMPSEQDVDRIRGDISDFNVFYCDRASLGIRTIMDAVREKNGIVLYEPNSCRNIETLLENTSHADIVKFSRDKVFPSVAERIRTSVKKLKLIISTEGELGLSFSHIQEDGRMSKWIHISSKFNGPIIDTSGAGDWLTAGFISDFISKDKEELNNKFHNAEVITAALIKGMEYSQLCCAAIGAQGAFYSRESVGIIPNLNEISGKLRRIAMLGNENFSIKGLCPVCLSKIS